MKDLLQQRVKTCLNIFKDEKKDRQSKYEVISHEDNFENSGKIYVKVRVKGLSKTFFKTVGELYKKNGLKIFREKTRPLLRYYFYLKKVTIQI